MLVPVCLFMCVDMQLITVMMHGCDIAFRGVCVLFMIETDGLRAQIKSR